MTEKSTPAPAEGAPLTSEEIKSLVTLVADKGIEELEVETSGQRLRIIGRRAPQVFAAPTPMAPAPSAMPSMAPPTAEAPVADAHSAPAEKAAPEPKDNPRYKKITAPMVGTFYRAPSPDSPHFAEKGDRVDENSVLCIIEAMKLMNEIKAEMRGVIVDILVDNAQPVEYGQPIFLIDPS